MIQALIIVHMVAAIAMVTCILLQQGRGATAGAGFGGSAASGSVFGAKGSANFLSRTTAILAATFFATSLALSVMGGRTAQPEKDLLDDVEVPAIEQDIPGALESDVPAPTVPDVDQQAIPEDLPENDQPPVLTE